MDFLITLLPLALFMVLIYFLTIRPQKKRQEEHKNMIQNLSKGDRVVTIGGLHGIVDEQDDVSQTVVIDCEGVYLTFEKRAIARVNSKADTNAHVESLGSNEPNTTDEVE